MRAIAAWQRALQEFIAPYRARPDVIGALVCGSYVTGAPSPRSDIDVVIVLAPSAKFRERGNRIVSGYLFEYFVGPPAQFRAYFADGHARSRPNTATMFATGRVLFDPRGAVRRLRAQARQWLRRPLRPLQPSELAHERYFYWDSLDNLRDLDEQGSPAYAHAYHHHVYDVYSTYARFLRQPLVRPRQLYAYLSDARARKKYLQSPFPDRRFAALLRRALCASDARAMRQAAEALTAHATERLGGFEIDGFRLRTPVAL
jgi:predicted nucleotidyltransferase